MTHSLAVQNMGEVSILDRGPETLHAVVNGAKVSFLGFPYPLLFRPERFLGVAVADPRDIACMKINAIAARGTKSDFVDLYVVSQQSGLSNLVALFEKEFAAANYSLVHILKSLTYFDDAEKDPMPNMLADLRWEDIRCFFSVEAPRLL